MCILLLLLFTVEDGNCTIEGTENIAFDRHSCFKCRCDSLGQKLCYKAYCSPPPSTEKNCIRQTCLETPVPGACCRTYSFCRCTGYARPPAEAPTTRTLDSLSVRPHVCDQRPSCPSHRLSGRNISSLRYVYDHNQRRCVMFWQAAGCSQTTNFASLSECRRRCVQQSGIGKS